MFWMIMPVVLLAGVGWWRARGGSVSTLQGAPSDLTIGPPRLEAGEWTDAPLSPSEVSRGFLVKKLVSVWQGGRSPVPEGTKPGMYLINTDEDVRVVFRRGKVWRTARTQPFAYDTQFMERKTASFGTFALRRDLECKINLNGVPRDAEEVRLRGHFVYINAYQGGVCRLASSDPRWKYYPPRCEFINRSQPFDLPVKTARGAWPAPQVSHEAKVEVIGAAWFKFHKSYEFALHLRHKEKRDWDSDPTASAQKMRLFDANHREVTLFENYGSGSQTFMDYFGIYNQEIFHPDKPHNEIMVPLFGENSAPKHGWGSVKRPLWLEGEIDDGECWPTPFKVRIEECKGNQSSYGAPQLADEP